MIRQKLIPTGLHAKARGAYYTDAGVAEFLVRWAVRGSREHVLDPSFGGGVFLEAACARIEALGGTPERQAYGIELDRRTHAVVTSALQAQRGVPRANLVLADFFQVPVSSRYDAVVGNPPFIRYHRFAGATRERALKHAEALGVKLTSLSSSWAPFLVKSAAHLKPGGRLAMVVPAEIGHAAYALPVLRYLHRSFESVTFLSFRERLFPDLAEDTLLVLGDNFGGSSLGFFWRDLEGPKALEEIRSDEELRCKVGLLDARAMLSGERRLFHHLLPAETWELYSKARLDSRTGRLGELVDIGIGYVTGANDFFHLHPDRAQALGIERRFLRKAVRRGRSLAGAVYTPRDWREGLESGSSGCLLYLLPGSRVTPGLRKYLEQGELEGLHERYKCRTRKPWYCVPHVYEPIAFLTYMSGAAPRLVANSADVVATNSLHVLRRLPGRDIGPTALALFWNTSLTSLSAEIEGHSMGGGMLKLEPTEAERVLVAVPRLPADVIRPLIERVDRCLRRGETPQVLEMMDARILGRELGLDPEDCERIRAGAEQLRARRCGAG